jgi:hypothetical protein
MKRRAFTLRAWIYGLVVLVVIASHLLALAEEASVPASAPQIGTESAWPLVTKANATTLTVHQPQLDSWDGGTLTARVAVQAAHGNPSKATFGVLTLQARTLIDKGRRIVTIDAVRIVNADFPSAAPADVRAWSDAIARDLATRKRTMALDRLEVQLGVAQTAAQADRKPLRDDPPRIVFSTVPALLIAIDGEPVLRPLAGTSYERVLNTRPLLLRDASGRFLLKVFDGWMSTPSLDAAWTVVDAPSPRLAQAFAQVNGAHLVDPLSGQPAVDQPPPSLKQVVPAIVVAAVPTELIVTDGAPRWAPVAGTHLLYIENTTGRVLKDTSDNATYVLVTGRWFRAEDERGPWRFVAANALPADFSRIPDESSMENVKASVGGTPQAAEAAIAATVPQSAAVKVTGTQPTAILFDGAPRWKTVEGAPGLEYALNTPTAVVRVGAHAIYAVQNGIWFFASSATGPWTVATSVPSAIYAIPPSSPLHYVTYVRVYAVVGDTIYVGYSPGYQGTYVDPSSGVVVYGTGYAYEPWLGSVWYGYPVTYGYAAAVAYTPWTGWAVAFGLGWAWGAVTSAWGWGWGPYPYWGPWSYPAWYGVAVGPRGGAVAWGPSGWAGYSGNIYAQWGNRAGVTRVGGGYDAWTGNAWAGQVGASYNSRTGVASAGQRGAVANAYTGNYAQGSRGVATGPRGNVVLDEHGTIGNAYTGNAITGGRGAVYDRSTGQVTTFGHVTGEGGATVGHIGDDVYAGKDGNVYRNTGDGWQRYTPGGGWNDVPGSKEGQATRNATGGLGASEHTRDLEQQRAARESGGDRAARLQRSSMNMHRSFAGAGRGGMRRR